MKNEWVTTVEAAKALAVSGSRVRAMVGDGLLVAEKRGRDLMVSSVSIAAQKSDYGQLGTPVRIRVFLRDNLTCQECGLASEDPSDFHVHHKQPRAGGGTNAIENLTTLCCDCHRDAHGRAPGGRTITMRLGEDVAGAITELSETWGCSRNAAVQRALIEMCAIVESGGEVGGDESISAATGTPSERTAAAVGQLEGAVASEPAAAPFNPKCFHCGQNFGAWNRNASLCPGCKERNHYGDPRECRACGDLQGAL